MVIDGPFAETKEQLLGFYVVDCGDLEAAIDVARDLAVANPDRGAYEIRPLAVYRPGEPDRGAGEEGPHEGGRRMTIANIDAAWIDAALTAARPQAVAALLRYFRDLDTAEEAFQDACLRALKAWPKNGPPRDPTAWLILVGRNAALDGVRKQSKSSPLPAEELISDLEDAEAALVDRLDGEHYRDDVLRLLFICCHPDLPATQQVAVALRIVSGLSVRQIARAFLVGESAMEQRITRAKARIGAADVPFGAPGLEERAERLNTVAAMVYLVFNEGYSAGGKELLTRGSLCDEAIRLARLLLRLFPSEPEIMGLTALLLLQHARAPARFDADGAVVLLEDQDRAPVERADDRRGPGPDRQGRAPSPARALSGAGRHRRRARPRRAGGRHRLGADRPAVRRPGATGAVAGGHPEPRRGGVEGGRDPRRPWR
jgi:RNA polymerase sigma factor (sigma-70 family)